MSKLNRSILRKLIIQELRSIVDEDALMPSPQLGQPNYLDLDSDNEEEGCGSLDDADIDDSEFKHFKGTLKDLGAHLVSDVDFEIDNYKDLDQDVSSTLADYINEGCGCGCNGAPGGCSSYEDDTEEDPQIKQKYEAYWENPMKGSAHVEDMTGLNADSGFALDKNLGYSGDFDEIEDHDHKSSYMAKPQIRKIEKYAAAIDDMIHPGKQLDDWIESKIAQIAQSVGDIYHSLDYKKNKQN